MKTARQKADEWVTENIVLSENCDIEYLDVIEKLELLLKEQDRDTRHACAEASIKVDNLIRSDIHTAVMNVRAV